MKRKLFTETTRERIIEVFATISGITGGVYGGILFGEIKDGVVHYSVLFSLYGGIAGIVIATLICGVTPPFKIRNFLERFISNIFSIFGAVLFGLTVGGFFGSFLNSPFFMKIYNSDIYRSIIAIDSNIGDGILVGGISGGIGCTIGSAIDSIFSFFLDIIFRFVKKDKDAYVSVTAEKPQEKKPAAPQQAVSAPKK